MNDRLLLILFFILFSCGEKTPEKATPQQSADEKMGFVLNAAGDTFYLGRKYFLPGKFVPKKNLPEPKVEPLLKSKIFKNPNAFPAVIVDSVKLSDLIKITTPGKGQFSMPILEKVNKKVEALVHPSPSIFPEMRRELNAPYPLFSSENSPLRIHAKSILIDHDENVWITAPLSEALIKYNGTHYWKYEIGKRINSGLFEDSQQSIWATSMPGIREFFKLTQDSIYTFNQSFSLLDTRNVFTEDEKGNIWIATRSKGIAKYNGTQFKIFNTQTGLLSNWARCFSFDKSGDLWIGTSGGISIFDGNQFMNIDLRKAFGDGYINGIYHENNRHWIIAGRYGIFKIEGDYLYKYSDEINGSKIKANKMIIHDDGKKFIGTHNLGLLEFSDGHYHTILEKSELLFDVRDIVVDTNNNLWFVGVSDFFKLMLNRFQKTPDFLPYANSGVASALLDKKKDLYVFYNRGQILKKEATGWFEISNLNTSNYEFFRGPFCDSENNIWFGLNDGNLYKVRDEKLHVFDNSKLTPGHRTNRIKEFSNGSIWYSTGARSFSDISNTGGLVKIDSVGNTYYTSSFGFPVSQSGEFIESSDGSVWTGANNFLYQIKNDSFSIYKFSDGGFQNYIIWLTERSDGSILFISNQGDFLKWSKGELVHNEFPKNERPNKPWLYDGWLDSRENLWLIGYTNSYMLPAEKLDGEVKSEDFLIFSIEDGFNEAGMPNPMYGDKEGNQFLNSDGQLVLFDSDQFLNTPENLRIKIHEIEIKSRDSIFRFMINTEIANSNSLELNSNSNTLRFIFSANDIQYPHRLKYKYRLFGFEENWAFTENPFIEYQNLPSGNYDFQIKANGFYNRKSDVKTFKFQIHPPWYLSWYAKTGYGIVFFISVFAFIKWREQKIIAKSQKELEASKRLAESEIKSKVLANVSHEFRTPLTIIKGATESLRQKPSEAMLSSEKIDKQANVLLRLVDKLLNMAKYKQGEAILEFRSYNMANQARLVLAQFESLAKTKSLSLKLLVNLNSGEQVYNREALDTILKNLLSNAIKFSKNGGDIKIELTEDRNFYAIKVIDQGMGISEEHQHKIFDRFYQVPDDTNQRGTGIGLSMVKELVEWHKGEIKVESRAGEGSSFIIHIPNNLLVSEDNELSLDSGESQNGIESRTVTISDRKESAAKQKVLVVEDNPDLTEMMNGILSPNYEVINAQNGRVALEKCSEFLPDFIISDIMMPEMDGLSFCMALKKNDEMAHIPVIILTAKASEDDKIEALKAGAHDFLAKPFNKEELLIKVDNILSERANLYRKIQSDPAFLFHSDSRLLQANSSFLQNLKNLIEMNYSEPERGIDWYAESLSIGKATFIKKIRNVSGMSFGNYLRKYRLNQAAELLKNPENQVSEVCFKVGYNNLSYFTKIFKKEFGESPKAFQKGSK